jgi:DNA-binding FrmR family transcriptional regulator
MPPGPLRTYLRQAHLDGQRDLADEIARLHADDGATDDAMRLLVEHQLGETFTTADTDRARRLAGMQHSDPVQERWWPSASPNWKP